MCTTCWAATCTVTTKTAVAIQGIVEGRKIMSSQSKCGTGLASKDIVLSAYSNIARGKMINVATMSIQLDMECNKKI